MNRNGAVRIVRLVFFFLVLGAGLARAEENAKPADTTVTQSGDVVRADKTVGIPPPKSDAAIAARLKRILSTTGWFDKLKVASQEGVVTIFGEVAEPSQRDWAVDLAQDADGVVAVIDKVTIRATPWFDLQPTRKEIATIWKDFFRFLPHLLIALGILAISVVIFLRLNTVTENFWRSRLTHPVLADVMGKIGALPVLLIGLYLILQVLGLTGLAFTVLGGTGALGLIVGFAFNNILQNYFSGIILSLWKPFLVGDVVEVAGQKGVVFRMTTRGTTLVDFDGNHIMIPNTTVFTNIIKNHTASPYTRVRLTLAAEPDVPVEKQKRIVADYLRSRAEVQKSPEQEVIVDGHSDTTELEARFWINVRENSAEKIRDLFGAELRALLRGEHAAPAAKPLSTKSEAQALLRQASREPVAGEGRELLREVRP